MPGGAPLLGAVLILAMLTPGAAMAGPWTMPKGKGQVIVKYEDMRADEGFDPAGLRRPLWGEQRDRALRSFSEYGLTDRLTLQLKADWEQGEDAFGGYDGRGPIEVGATWQVWRDDRGAVSVYAGYASNGDGRNALYADPGIGREDVEIRVSAGRSFNGAFGMSPRRAPDHSFAEVQVAGRSRDGLPNEIRIDATVGAHFGDRWMLMGQAFAGRADEGFAPGAPGARWLSLETTLVRHFGPWSVQGGWRQAVAGRDAPVSRGPVLAVWRRF